MPVILYKRQRQILDFINQYIQKNGFAPSLTEIASALGVSSLATVHEHLAAMAKKGVIKRFQGAVRGIEIVNPESSRLDNGVELPVLGFIAAGSPIEPYTDPHASMAVPPGMLSGKKSQPSLSDSSGKGSGDQSVWSFAQSLWRNPSCSQA